MQTIPDTGGGLSGFLAHCLWLIYAHFPGKGEFDWWLLFLCLGLGTYFLFLPYLWKSVQADMALLKNRTTTENSRPSQGIEVVLFASGMLFLFLWFFHTSAGRTFFASNHMTEVHRGVFWGSFVVLFVLLGALGNIEGKSAEMRKHTTITKTQHHPNRDLLHLYEGGGIFVYLEKGAPKVDSSTSTVAL